MGICSSNNQLKKPSICKYLFNQQSAEIQILANIYSISNQLSFKYWQIFNKQSAEIQILAYICSIRNKLKYKYLLNHLSAKIQIFAQYKTLFGCCCNFHSFLHNIFFLLCVSRCL